MDVAARKRMMNERLRWRARAAVTMFTLLCTEVTERVCDDGLAGGVCDRWFLLAGEVRGQVSAAPRRPQTSLLVLAPLNTLQGPS